MGRLILGLKLESGADFSEGLAAASLGGRSGYINTEGDWVIEPQFDSCRDFRESRAAVRIGDWMSGKWGFIDRRGSFVVEPQYPRVEDFGCGRALVTTEQLEAGGARIFVTGFIDVDGHEVVPLSSRQASSFSEDRAAVSVPTIKSYHAYPPPFPTGDEAMDNLLRFERAPWAFIDRYGKICTSQYTRVEDFHEGLARVIVGEPECIDALKCKYIDRQDRVVIELGDGDFGWGFSEGLTVVENRTTERIHYIDRTGSPVTRILPFSRGGEFHEGLAVVRTPAKVRGHSTWMGSWGFIDRKGRTAIKPQFTYAEPFHNGLARVNVGAFCSDELSDGEAVINSKTGYIDHKGSYVWEPNA